VTARAALAPPVLKVCGVTTVEDARGIAALGVELVGLNFHPGSPRCLDVDAAREVRRALGDRTLAVGVFVDAPLERLLEVERRVGLDLLQLHGSEPDEAMAEIAARTILALRAPEATSGDAASATNAGSGIAERNGSNDPGGAWWALLFDTPARLLAPGQRGGSGRSWHYEALAPLVEASAGRRILVAGGVSPSNAGAVLACVPGLFGLDVCSGVESAPGRKDLERVAALLEVVRAHRAGDRHPAAATPHPIGDTA
jgi:phosphoribosylanthranilate isomerase